VEIIAHILTLVVHTLFHLKASLNRRQLLNAVNLKNEHKVVETFVMWLFTACIIIQGGRCVPVVKFEYILNIIML